MALITSDCAPTSPAARPAAVRAGAQHAGRGVRRRDEHRRDGGGGGSKGDPPEHGAALPLRVRFRCLASPQSSFAVTVRCPAFSCACVFAFLALPLPFCERLACGSVPLCQRLMPVLRCCRRAKRAVDSIVHAAAIEYHSGNGPSHPGPWSCLCLAAPTGGDRPRDRPERDQLRGATDANRRQPTPTNAILPPTDANQRHSPPANAI